MVFMVILAVVAFIASVLLGWYAEKECSDFATGGCVLFGLTAVTFLVLLVIFSCDARVNKALMQNYIEKPSNYTYEQLAEHNKFVTKSKVWQGTIFSFYNDVDLQTIDIDSVSQKVIIK